MPKSKTNKRTEYLEYLCSIGKLKNRKDIELASIELEKQDINNNSQPKSNKELSNK